MPAELRQIAIEHQPDARAEKHKREIRCTEQPDRKDEVLRRAAPFDEHAERQRHSDGKARDHVWPRSLERRAIGSSPQAQQPKLQHPADEKHHRPRQEHCFARLPVRWSALFERPSHNSERGDFRSSGHGRL
jgi:hypothetical protein